MGFEFLRHKIEVSGTAITWRVFLECFINFFSVLLSINLIQKKKGVGTHLRLGNKWMNERVWNETLMKKKFKMCQKNTQNSK